MKILPSRSAVAGLSLVKVQGLTVSAGLLLTGVTVQEALVLAIHLPLSGIFADRTIKEVLIVMPTARGDSKASRRRVWAVGVATTVIMPTICSGGSVITTHLSESNTSWRALMTNRVVVYGCHYNDGITHADGIFRITQRGLAHSRNLALIPDQNLNPDRNLAQNPDRNLNPTPGPTQTVVTSPRSTTTAVKSPV